MYPSLVFTLTGDPPAFAACIRSVATSGWRIIPTPFLIANEELIVVSASSPHYLFQAEKYIRDYNEKRIQYNLGFVSPKKGNHIFINIQISKLNNEKPQTIFCSLWFLA